MRPSDPLQQHDLPGPTSGDLRRTVLAVLAMLAALAGAPAAAAAHDDHLGAAGSVREGFLHPITGIDHLLTMIAVGLVSVVLARGAVWKIPTTFVALLLGGAVVGYVGYELLGVELWILAALALIGIVLATQSTPRLTLALAAVGFFGFAHGNAHGLELPLSATPLAYAAGFVGASVSCHLTGIVIGATVMRTRIHKPLMVVSGWALVGASLGIWLQA